MSYLRRNKVSDNTDETVSKREARKAKRAEKKSERKAKRAGSSVMGNSQKGNGNKNRQKIKNSNVTINNYHTTTTTNTKTKSNEEEPEKKKTTTVVNNGGGGKKTKEEKEEKTITPVKGDKGDKGDKGEKGKDGSALKAALWGVGAGVASSLATWGINKWIGKKGKPKGKPKGKGVDQSKYEDLMHRKNGETAQKKQAQEKANKNEELFKKANEKKREVKRKTKEATAAQRANDSDKAVIRKNMKDIKNSSSKYYKKGTSGISDDLMAIRKKQKSGINLTPAEKVKLNGYKTTVQKRLETRQKVKAVDSRRKDYKDYGVRKYGGSKSAKSALTKRSVVLSKRCKGGRK